MAFHSSNSQAIIATVLLEFASKFQYLAIYDGTRPAMVPDNVPDDNTRLLLFELDSISDPVNIGGVTTVILDWGDSGASAIAGVPTWFRCYKDNPNDAVEASMDGSIGIDTSFDLTMDTEIEAGVTYTLNEMPLTMENGADITSDSIRFGLPLGASTAAFGAAAKYLEIYSGSQPASPDYAPTDSVLLVRTIINPDEIPSTGFAVLSLENFPDGDLDIDFEIVGTGVPTWFRITDSSGAGLMDGTVGYTEFPTDAWPQPAATHDMMLSVNYFDHINYDPAVTIAPYYPDINLFAEYEIPAIDRFGSAHPYFPFEYPEGVFI